MDSLWLPRAARCWKAKSRSGCCEMTWIGILGGLIETIIAAGQLSRFDGQQARLPFRRMLKMRNEDPGFLERRKGQRLDAACAPPGVAGRRDPRPGDDDQRMLRPYRYAWGAP